MLKEQKNKCLKIHLMERLAVKIFEQTKEKRKIHCYFLQFLFLVNEMMTEFELYRLDYLIHMLYILHMYIW